MKSIMKTHNVHVAFSTLLSLEEWISVEIKYWRSSSKRKLFKFTASASGEPDISQQTAPLAYSFFRQQHTELCCMANK